MQKVEKVNVKQCSCLLSSGKGDLMRIETKNNVSNETCQGHQFVMPGLSDLQRSFQFIVLQI